MKGGWGRKDTLGRGKKEQSQEGFAGRRKGQVPERASGQVSQVGSSEPGAVTGCRGGRWSWASWAMGGDRLLL